MEKDSKQRVLFCRKCGNMVYPAIAPVVTNGDKLLMTKYADRPLFQWVLISRFCGNRRDIGGSGKKRGL